jgi:hypothetical protein
MPTAVCNCVQVGLELMYQTWHVKRVELPVVLSAFLTLNWPHVCSRWPDSATVVCSWPLPLWFLGTQGSSTYRLSKIGSSAYPVEHKSSSMGALVMATQERNPRLVSLDGSISHRSMLCAVLLCAKNSHWVPLLSNRCSLVLSSTLLPSLRFRWRSSWRLIVSREPTFGRLVIRLPVGSARSIGSWFASQKNMGVSES